MFVCILNNGCVPAVSCMYWFTLVQPISWAVNTWHWWLFYKQAFIDGWLHHMSCECHWGSFSQTILSCITSPGQSLLSEVYRRSGNFLIKDNSRFKFSLSSLNDSQRVTGIHILFVRVFNFWRSAYGRKYFNSENFPIYGTQKSSFVQTAVQTTLQTCHH